MSYISQTRHEPCSLLLKALLKHAFNNNYDQQVLDATMVHPVLKITDFHETHISQVHYWIMHVFHSATTTFVYQMSSF